MKLLLLAIIIMIAATSCSESENTPDQVVRNYKVKNLESHTINIVKAVEPITPKGWNYTIGDTVIVNPLLNRIMVVDKGAKCIITEYIN